MQRLRPALSLLLTALLGLSASSAAIHVLEDPRGAESSHQDGTTCPDRGEEPCDEDCACPCCHGRSPSLAPRLAALVTAAPPQRPHQLARPEGLFPRELVQRVFRPPRRSL